MASAKTGILTTERETELRRSIDEYIGSIQAQIDELRADGTDKVIRLQGELDSLRRDRIYSQEEKKQLSAKKTQGLPAAQWLVPGHLGDFCRSVHHHPPRQGRAPIDGEQCAEHLKAGLSQNVPGFGGCRTHLAGWYGPVHWENGGHGHHGGNYYHAPGHQHRFCLWADL